MPSVYRPFIVSPLLKRAAWKDSPSPLRQRLSLRERRNMLKTTLSVFVISVALIAVQACAPLGAPTSNPNSTSTAVAQTVIAGVTQTSVVGIPITGQESPTPTASPIVVTMTPSAIILSPSPVFTATSVAPQVSVSVATNCRTGPGVAYERVGALLVGQTAEVVGRNTRLNYWVIRNPDGTGQLCWLWGQFATVTGDINALPEVTPPPLPSPTATSLPTITLTPVPSSISIPPSATTSPAVTPTVTSTP